MTISIPESVNQYYKDRAIHTAVKDLIDQLDGKKMPVSEWGEQKSYHEALLMAAKVRADFAKMLFDFHEQTWGSLDDLKHKDNDPWSPSEMWNDGCVQRDFWFDNNRKSYASFGVCLSEKAAFIYVEKSDSERNRMPVRFGNRVTISNLPQGWMNKSPEKDWDALTCSPLVPINKFLENPNDVIGEFREGASELTEAFKEVQK